LLYEIINVNILLTCKNVFSEIKFFCVNSIPFVSSFHILIYLWIVNNCVKICVQTYSFSYIYFGRMEYGRFSHHVQLYLHYTVVVSLIGNQRKSLACYKYLSNFWGEGNLCRYFIVCWYMYCRWRSSYQEVRVRIPLPALTVSHFCARHKTGSRFQASYAVVLMVLKLMTRGGCLFCWYLWILTD
jgi:hypothetical protein